MNDYRKALRAALHTTDRAGNCTPDCSACSLDREALAGHAPPSIPGQQRLSDRLAGRDAPRGQRTSDRLAGRDR